MLLTRCPECDTTFRVTDETLKKASGQVRCGRCASVFNAYTELHHPAAKSFEPEQLRTARADPTADPQAAAAGIGSASVTEVAAEASVAAADAATVP